MSSESCIVCLEDTSMNIKSIKHLIKICECEYWIHENCINAWLIKEPICPICKKLMIYENEERSVDNNGINNNGINNNGINNNGNYIINNTIVIRNSIITIIGVLIIVIILILTLV
jgi:hypothetical protein